MESLFARALYDNTAETEDELAFHKGDIIRVLEKNIAGSTGWWKCSLLGHQGLAPANRLGPLLPAEEEKFCKTAEEKCCKTAEIIYNHNHSIENIYQAPKGHITSDIDIYEDMNTLYMVPFQAFTSPEKQENAERTGSLCDKLSSPPRTGAEIYDVPNLVRKSSILKPSTVYTLHTSPVLNTKFQTGYERQQNARCCTTASKKVATLPLLASQYPNHDIPLTSTSDDIKSTLCDHSTLTNFSKTEWIYDVPVFKQKHKPEPGFNETLPSKTVKESENLYDILPERKKSMSQPLYDFPKPSSQAVQTCTGNDKSSYSCIYNILPCHKQTETIKLSRSQSLKSDSNSQESLEYCCKPGPYYNNQHCWPARARTISRQPMDGMIRRDNDGKDHQRSSTVSTSSTASSSSRSSCDSFMLSSPEPEHLRELTLSQEEAGKRLLKLQEAVCQSVPKLMLFVSSLWRRKDHLSQHLDQIHTATENVTDSLNCFLNFALDVRGNAQRLTDLNLQTRLLKQLTIVEDSGLILQQASSALQDLGWRLDMLALDDGQMQMPDHLERFVMVARTVPEDVKRLVSILNANGKLLFRVPTKERDVVENVGSTKQKSNKQSEATVDSGIDESDHVQLQTKPKLNLETRPTRSSFKSKRNGDSLKKQLTCSTIRIPGSPSISDHCRLYFGAIQKAIGVFLNSLNEDKPPEKFISDSKLIIMVGQRLVSTLCSEAKSREASQEMLSMSNQLCAQMKQLAMVTKKAALNFPDKQTVQEAQETARELAQRAQHFRMTLDV